MSDKLYCYPPDYTVLKNKFEIRDSGILDAAERAAVIERLSQGLPSGKFDLSHLQAIHKHLFQDVYEWAGQTRQTPLSKGGSAFMPPDRIGTAMSDVHNRLVARNYLKGLSKPEFAKEAGQILGDVNFTHPFREGNGRTQFQYLKQLGQQAGHEIDLTRFDRETWIAASRAAKEADYGPMGQCIAKAIGPERERSGLDKRTQALLEKYRTAREFEPERGKDREQDREDEHER